METQYMKDLSKTRLRLRNSVEFELQEEVNSYVGDVEYVTRQHEERNDKIMKYNVSEKITAFDIQVDENARQEQLKQAMLSGKKEDKIRANIVSSNNAFLKEKEAKTTDNYENVEKIQKRLEKIRCNPDIIAKFAPGYIGEHFAEVRYIIDEIAAIAEIFKKQNGIYDIIRDRNIISYDFIKFSENCQRAFDTSLAIHKMRYDRKSGTVFEINEKEKKIANTKLVDDLRAITFVFKEAQYEKDARNVSELSRQYLSGLESKEYAGKQSNIEEQEVVIALREKITAEDTDILQNKKMINDLIEDYSRFDRMQMLEEGRLVYMQEQKNQHIAQTPKESKNLQEHHFDNVIMRIRKTVLGLQEEKKRIRNILQIINQKKEFTEEQKDYLSRCYGKVFQKYTENPEQENIQVRTYEELEQSVKEMCERLYNCRTKHQFLSMKRELCTLAAELEEMIERNVGRDHDFYKETGIWKLNVNKILFSAKKARAIEMISGCKRMSFGRDDLSLQEYNSIATAKGLPVVKEGEMRSLEITSVDIIHYAKDSFNTAEIHMDRLRKEFMKEPETKTHIYEMQRKYRFDFGEKETRHEEFSKQYTELYKLKSRKGDLESKHTKGILNEQEQKDYAKIQGIMQEYAKRKQRIQELLAEYKSLEDETEKQNKYQELKAFISDVHMYEIAEKMQHKYYVYGRIEEKADCVLRATDSVDHAPAYRDMNDEEMKKIFGMMSAGVFEEEEQDTVLRELYLEVNKEGMSLYKDKMFEHYNYMYEKYGLTYPSIEYVYEHFREMQIDFSLGQVDTMMQDKISLFLDKNNPRDVLLMALAGFYQEMNTRFVVELSAYYNERPDGGSLTPEQFYDRLRMLWAIKIGPFAEKVKSAMANV